MWDAIRTGYFAMPAEVAFAPSDVSPVNLVLGSCLKHIGFLSAFLSLMDFENEGTDG